MKKQLVQMVVYKRVLSLDGKLVSCISDDPNLHLVYEVGKTIKPKIRRSALFAFKTYKAAQAANTYSGYNVMKCNALVNPRRRKKVECGYYDLASIKKFWESKFIGPMTPLLPDAVYCEEVTPIEYIPDPVRNTPK
jgi:hypothetical protein